jgi:dynein heavy chain
VLISSGAVAYLGAFVAKFRDNCISDWVAQCHVKEIPCSSDIKLFNVLGDAVLTRKWVIEGLPNDSFSIDSAIIISKSRRWPLMIDPQNQANKWIKNMEKDNKLVVFKQTDDYARLLENAITFGAPCLLENVGEDIDPSLEPLLLKQVFRKGNTKMIRFGDSEIEYSDGFRFYITTKLRNPHYMPEVSTKVTLLNFMITPEGLEDQLLGIVVEKEKPELEEERSRLVVTSAENARKLKEIEDEILQVLATSGAAILDDQKAIEILSASKVVSNDIEEKQRQAEKTTKEIDVTRMGYKPVAFHSSVLFFCIADLCQIDPMYQYSLAWYILLFKKGIASSEFSPVLATRIHNLNDTFTYMLYANICRSLFEKDKLLFAFLMNCRLFQSSGRVSPAHWRFLITGGLDIEKALPANPCKWLDKKSWAELNRLTEQGEEFKPIVADFGKHANEWLAYYESAEPHLAALPGALDESLDRFKKMMILRCLRSDKLIPAFREYVKNMLGAQYIEAPPFDLAGAYKDSNNVSPIIFILSPGADPMGAFKKFAGDNGYADRYESISLGQGQGVIAEKMIEKAIRSGHWVVLQNCHLYTTWMKELERICEEVNPTQAHPNYRLWCTSYPSADFPVAILQNGVKLTTEPPKGLRANLLNSYYRDPISDEKFFTNCKKSRELKNLVFSLCFFHALVQERCNFGPLGWNIPYGFNDSDMQISVRQLQMFLNESGAIQYKALRYLTGECNYGGRVTDDWDRRCLNNNLMRFYIPDLHNESFCLAEGYPLPPEGPVQSYIEYIKALPIAVKPDAFGLHSNADITKDKKETGEILLSVLNTEARSGGGGANDKTTMLSDLASDILRRLPPRFDTDLVQANYPVVYNESMNTVLGQECIRYNKLTDLIRSSLENLKKALVGEVVMSSDLETVSDDMFNGLLPVLWAGASYPSLKPLGGYITDLLARLKFLNDWIVHEPPSVYWISGFFFTQSFLTGALQNYARKHKIAIDEVGFDFEFMDTDTDDGKIAKPSDGIYCRGLFIEGARWDYAKRCLGESEPKVLFTPCPIIWFKPCKVDDIVKVPHYVAPVYRTTARRGVLSTTGHSTNFVLPLRVPSDQPEQHWILRGVALVTMLND